MITVVGSLKGGSGKSTLTFNLAVWLAMADTDVVLVDCDPQATLTDVVEVRTEEGYDPRIKVLDSNGLDAALADEQGEMLIDVGTADIESLKKALKMADRVVIPVPPSQADVWSTQRFIRFVEEALGDREMPELVAFINRADTHRAIRESDEAAAALISLPGIDFVKQRLCQRTVFRRSFSEGLAVFELDPRGKASREFNSLTAALYPQYLRA